MKHIVYFILYVMRTGSEKNNLYVRHFIYVNLI